MVDGLTILSEDVQNRQIVYNLLLVLSGILTDKNGETCYMFISLWGQVSENKSNFTHNFVVCIQLKKFILYELNFNYCYCI